MLTNWQEPVHRQQVLYLLYMIWIILSFLLVWLIGCVVTKETDYPRVQWHCMVPTSWTNKTAVSEINAAKNVMQWDPSCWWTQDSCSTVLWSRTFSNSSQLTGGYSELLTLWLQWMQPSRYVRGLQEGITRPLEGNKLLQQILKHYYASPQIQSPCTLRSYD